MHINEGEHVGFGEHGYNQVGEEPNDENHNDLADDQGKENENEGGHNCNSNDCREGGTTSIVVSGNNDAASIGNEDGGFSNASQEEPTKEGPNQGVELQNNPPLVDENVNFEVLDAIISAMDNMDLDKIVPNSHCCTGKGDFYWQNPFWSR
jgi:hypothetical protein